MVDVADAPAQSDAARIRVRYRQFVESLRARIAAWAAIDGPRIGLWAPVALGAGAVLYFELKTEPRFWVAPVIAAAALAAARAIEKRRTALFAVFLAALGFFAADFRAARIDAPILSREVKFATVEGRLLAVDEAPKLRRLIIETSSIEHLAPEATPERVRVSWRGKEFNAQPGDRISLTASLSPPPPPAAPGGFDFARQLYFQSIGAVGFAVSPPIVLTEARKPLDARFHAAIESFRVELSRRIMEKAGSGDSAAIVAAVVTGKREAISDEAEAAFRDSGLTHLLSISGLHMGLATGLIFFAVRALLALIEPVALTQPIKKWAAIAALLSGFLYLLISGGAWPAERAFIMSAIVFIAIIADRRALTLRNVAIAAFVLILAAPEAVLHPGFQMSFAAVTALIAWYEWSSARADPTRSFAWDARLRRYIAGVAITDIIASAATAPFGLYHFSRTANFGLGANLISIPLMGFWVMPAAIIALLLMPFGADGPFWRLAAGGVELMLDLAEWTMALPGAVTVLPSWPAAAIGVIALGGLWLCLMSAPWRLGGLAALPIAAVLIASEPHPAIFVGEEGENMGVVFRDQEGKRAFAVFNRRKGKFDTRVWMEQSGIDSEKTTPASLGDIGRCDDAGCVANVRDAVVAISNERAGLDDDCARADLVVALYPAFRREREGCAADLIDRRDAWNDGAHAVFISDDGIRIENAAAQRGARPWRD